MTGPRRFAFGSLTALALLAAGCGGPQEPGPPFARDDVGQVIGPEEPGPALRGGAARWPDAATAALEPDYTASLDRRRPWTRQRVGAIVADAVAQDTDLLVRLVPGAGPADLDAIAELRVERSLGSESGVHEVAFDPADADAVAAALAGLGSADVVAVNEVLSLARTPDDPRFAEQRALGAAPGLRAEAGWDLQTDGSGVVVAVLDTGVAEEHPDLRANVRRDGRDFTNGNDFQVDEQGHGTHVAGTIAAVGDNGRGIAGVAWTAEVLPLRVLDAEGNGTTADIVEAIYHAADAGASLINMSLGGGSPSKVMFDALSYARDRNALVIASAGNDGRDTDAQPSYPAGYALDNIVAVAAIDGDGRLAPFSNYGRESVDLAAPGVDVLSTYLGGGYRRLSGTSMAAPVVCGAAALLWSREPSLTYADVREALLTRVEDDPLLSGRVATGGHLDLPALLGAGSGTPSPTPPAPGPGDPTPVPDDPGGPTPPFPGTPAPAPPFPGTPAPTPPFPGDPAPVPPVPGDPAPAPPFPGDPGSPNPPSPGGPTPPPAVPAPAPPSPPSLPSFPGH